MAVSFLLFLSREAQGCAKEYRIVVPPQRSTNPTVSGWVNRAHAYLSNGSRRTFHNIGGIRRETLEPVIERILSASAAGEHVTVDMVRRWLTKENERTSLGRPLQPQTIDSMAEHLYMWGAREKMFSLPADELAALDAGFVFQLRPSETIRYAATLGLQRLVELHQLFDAFGEEKGIIDLILPKISISINPKKSLLDRKADFYSMLQEQGLGDLAPEHKFLLFLAADRYAVAMQGRTFPFVETRENEPAPNRTLLVQILRTAIVQYLDTSTKRAEKKNHEFVNSSEREAANSIGQDGYDILARGEDGVHGYLFIPLIEKYGDPAADILAQNRMSKGYLITEVKPNAVESVGDLEHALSQLESTLNYLKRFTGIEKPQVRLEIAVHGDPQRPVQFRGNFAMVHSGFLFGGDGVPIFIGGYPVNVRIVPRPRR